MASSTDTEPRPAPSFRSLLLPPGAVPRWVMIARVGRWEGHPGGPELITLRHLSSALAYFRTHHAAHGADLPVDYHHASVLAAARGGPVAPAAGWIQALELRNAGTELWGRVMWTADAAQDIARRRFRYLSPVLRFNVPDRVTGEPVPMLIHSVALTNTPFLTELPALNHQSAGQAPQRPFAQGGEAMPILEQMAAALGETAETLQCALGLESAQDTHVAETLLANAARLGQLPTQAAAPERPVSAAVAETLGVPPDADEATVTAWVLALRSAADLGPIRAGLGLPQDAPMQEMLNALDALQEAGHKGEAEQMVDGAVEAGRVPPAQREFFLRSARQDLEATRLCLNSLTPVLPERLGLAAGPFAPPGGRGLTDAEARVCRQLGLNREAFLAAADQAAP